MAWHLQLPSQVIDPAERQILADALGDTPESVAAVHGLTYGFYDAWTIGDPAAFDAAVVQPRILPTLAMGFGRDAEALARLLLHVPGWQNTFVPPCHAAAVSQHVARALGEELAVEDEIVYLPDGPLAEYADPRVRLIDKHEFDALAWVMEWGYTREVLENILLNGVISCAVVDGQTVSAAYTDCWTARFAEITVGTEDGWTNRGFATGAASLVAREVVKGGRTPVWSADTSNLASRRIAAKLGFVEASRRGRISRPAR
ncbi:MAG: GNAT family N-acetyltransferase [bacterium]